MSTIIMSQCWPLQIPPTAKAVLISLADNANDQGVCWPAIDRICERTCFGRTAVINAIRWLEDQRLVIADRSNGRHTSYEVHPEALNQSASRTGTPPGPVRQTDGNQSASRTNQSASRTGPVRQADSNRKEPSLTVKRTAKKGANAPPCPDDVDGQVWTDWLALRKAKRAPVTETVMRDAGREAAKAGLTLNRFLEIWCARGSQGLQADWLKPHERQGPPRNQATAAAAPSRTLTAIQTLQGLKHGNRLDSQRDSGRVIEAHLLELGQNPGR